MSRYTVYVQAGAWNELKALPGHIRQRARREIDNLADEPRPSRSKMLTPDEALSELRRLRLDRWRIVYSVNNDNLAVDVLAVRKRPPYDYGDLSQLIASVR